MSSVLFAEHHLNPDNVGFEPPGVWPQLEQMVEQAPTFPQIVAHLPARIMYYTQQQWVQ